MPIINQVVKGGGTTPTGTRNITSNGVYDVTDFASADVQVPTTAPAHYIELANNNGVLTKGTTLPSFTGVTALGDNIFYYQYNGVQFPANTNIIITDVVTVSGGQALMLAFSYSNIVSFTFDSVTTISGNSACEQMLKYCSNLTTLSFNSLTTISGSRACISMCESCSALTSVVFPSLSSVTGSYCLSYAFSYCRGLTSISFPALTSASFGSYNNQLDGIVSGVTGCTIHFPSNLDPAGGSTVISSLRGYPNFGGTNTVLAFDLSATE